MKHLKKTMAAAALMGAAALLPAGPGALRSFEAGVAAAYEMEERAPAEQRRSYNTEYLFAMTRGVADSTLITPLKPAVFLLTIPLDIVCLPGAAIAGFF